MAATPRKASLFTEILADEEMGFSVRCPALPGCVSKAEDRVSELANTREAIETIVAFSPSARPAMTLLQP